MVICVPVDVAFKGDATIWDYHCIEASSNVLTFIQGTQN